jgi:hypothetical protein
VGDHAQELRQLRRDRITLAMIVGIPVMQLLLFGYAINLNLRHLDAGVADQANSAASRALVQDMVATGVITPRSEAYTPDQLMQALRRGEISVGIVVPADFERRRFDGREAVQVLVDGSDTVVQSAAIQLAQVPLDTRPTSNTVPARRQHRQWSGQRDQLLQPAAALGGEHRARPDRGDPDHDPGDVHGGSGGARTRARQHGAADRHAGVAQRTDGRQGAALRPSACCRPRWCWCWAPGCSRCRSAAACWTSIWPRCCWCWPTWRWAC